jgi:hypothetical protein
LEKKCGLANQMKAWAPFKEDKPLYKNSRVFVQSTRLIMSETPA